jgi:hypothetical protein
VTLGCRLEGFVRVAGGETGASFGSGSESGLLYGLVRVAVTTADGVTFTGVCGCSWGEEGTAIPANASASAAFENVLYLAPAKPLTWASHSSLC